ncbi:MAG: hypothetical protein AAB663_02040 [Patescibacteria group bacterium]
MARNVFTLHIAFCPKSHRHDQYLPQFIRCDEEYTRNGLVTLMREFIAFSALFTWLHLPCEKVEEQATEPVVYTKGLRQFIQPATYSANFGDITDPDIIVIIGNEGTLGPTAMKREFPKSIVLWSTYTEADQRGAQLRVLKEGDIISCHDLNSVALKARVHALLAEKYGVTFSS